MYLPKGHKMEGNNIVCKLKRALYGLRQSGRAWNEALDKELINLDMKKNEFDPCMYYNICNNKILFILAYVDDMLVASNSSEMRDTVIGNLAQTFKIKSLGRPQEFLGIEIRQDEVTKSVTLSQEEYAERVLKRYGMDNCRPISTPLDANRKLQKDMGPTYKPCDETIPYQEVIGSLMYLVTVTPPDRAFVISGLSRYNKAPTTEHWAAPKRVLRYLRGTTTARLTYENDGDTELHGFSDADWAGDPDDRLSISGFCPLIGRTAVLWHSKKQRSVALSIVEAEYTAMSRAAQELAWVATLYDEIKGDKFKTGPIPLGCDNQGAIAVIKNANGTKYTRHIDVKKHFIKQLHKDKVIDAYYVPTNEMSADMMTKGLPRQKLARCLDRIGMHMK